jgi:hypothetical protein
MCERAPGRVLNEILCLERGPAAARPGSRCAVPAMRDFGTVPESCVRRTTMQRFDVGRVPEDEHARLIYLSNAFGRLLFEVARAPARERAKSIPESHRSEVEALLDSQLYAVLQVLDGVTVPIGNDQIGVEFVLKARLHDWSDAPVFDEVELGPDGEGLCMGFHGWVSGDFGGVPEPKG